MSLLRRRDHHQRVHYASSPRNIGSAPPRLRPSNARSPIFVAWCGVAGCILFTGSLLLFITILSVAADRSAHPFAEEPTVITVIDGDTIDVRVGYERHRIRLLGIDTPETKDPRKPVQCFGPEATRFTKSLLPTGTTVRLEFDLEQHDAFHRLLAYVWRVDDGTFINDELVRQGYATTLSIAPNTAHADEFRQSLLSAKQASRGRWSACERASDTPP